MNPKQQNICDDIMSFVSLNREQETFGRKELYAAAKGTHTTTELKAALSSLVGRGHIKKMGAHIFGLGNREGITPYNFGNGNVFSVNPAKSMKELLAEGEKKLRERQQLENTQRQQQLTNTVQQLKKLEPVTQEELADELERETSPHLARPEPIKPAHINLNTVFNPLTIQHARLQRQLDEIQSAFDECRSLIKNITLKPCRCGATPTLSDVDSQINQQAHGIALVCDCGLQTKPQYWFETQHESLYTALSETLEIWGYSNSTLENAA